jgi:hypothetical protein
MAFAVFANVDQLVIQNRAGDNERQILQPCCGILHWDYLKAVPDYLSDPALIFRFNVADYTI